MHRLNRDNEITYLGSVVLQTHAQGNRFEVLNSHIRSISTILERRMNQRRLIRPVRIEDNGFVSNFDLFFRVMDVGEFLIDIEQYHKVKKDTSKSPDGRVLTWTRSWVSAVPMDRNKSHDVFGGERRETDPPPSSQVLFLKSRLAKTKAATERSS